MKILFTHRYFWPDTPPYGAMLRSLAEAMAQRGHDVEVFAGQPSYGRDAVPVAAEEKLGPVTVKRTAMRREDKSKPVLRGWNAASYCAKMFWHVLRSDADVVMAASFPPVVAAWCASLAAKLSGKAFVYHLQDVHPEVALINGGPLAKAPLFNLLRWLDQQTLSRAGRIVILSGDMLATLKRRGGKFGSDKVRIINNFQVEAFAAQQAAADLPVKPDGKVRAIFAGNLGVFQRLDLFVDAARILLEKTPELELFFLGNGAAESALKEQAADLPNVKFHDFIPFEDARHLIQDADLGLVSLEPGVIGVSYPSKTFTYLGLGLPLGLVVEPDSQLAGEVRQNGLGFICDDPSPDGVATMLSDCAAQANQLPDYRVRCLAHYREHVAGDATFSRWSEMLNELDEFDHG